MLSLREILDLADTYERELPAPPELFTRPVGAEIASWIDHTLLKPEATGGQVKKLCEEARQYHFAAVCVNPVYVTLARSLLKGTEVGVSAVIAFPLGAMLPEDKVHEARRVIENGASEVDMVVNIGAIKGGAYGLVLNEIQLVTKAAHERKAIVKVIIEAALLTEREKILACLLSKTAGGDFVKTSTGFGPSGATVEDVGLMRRVVGAWMGVKAAGGIRTCQEALRMIDAGANRIGSSAGVSILKESLGASQ